MAIDYGLNELADREAHFRKRWEPHDPHEREQFNRELAMLIHTVYREASKPFVDHIMKILSALPMPVIIKKDNS